MSLVRWMYGPWFGYYGESLMEEEMKEREVTDDIAKVREAYKAALQEVRGVEPHVLPGFIEALAKRLQPRPEPVKKEWSVSMRTADRYHKQYGTTAQSLNAIAADIIRERPDLVAAEWERRFRLARDEQTVRLFLGDSRRALFPELDP